MKKLKSHKKKNLKYPALVAGLIGSLALPSCKKDVVDVRTIGKLKPNPVPQVQRLGGEMKPQTQNNQTEKDAQTAPRLKGKVRAQRTMGEIAPTDSAPRLLGKIKVSPKTEK